MTTYDVWKLSAGDEGHLAYKECANCQDESYRVGEMIDLPGGLLACSNDCAQEYIARELCANCKDKPHSSFSLDDWDVLFCSSECMIQFDEEREANKQSRADHLKDIEEGR